MAKIKPRVKVPKSAEVGEIITIKSLISHPMESGQRKDKKTGELIPRNIINNLLVTFEGDTVFEAEILPAVSTNPYFEFTMKVPGPGEVAFKWVADDGEEYGMSKKITIG